MNVIMLSYAGGEAEGSYVREEANEDGKDDDGK